MKIVGLTGGIACGKSSVSRLLDEKYGIPIIDADEIAHSVLAPGSSTYGKVISAFGKDVLADPASHGGAIDRKKLGAVVFSDESARRRLGGIMNPAIAWTLGVSLLSHFARGTAIVVLDVPLLYETGMDKICDVVIAVVVSPSTQLARLSKRDAAGETDARQRIAAQKLTAAEKGARAHVALSNDSTKDALAAEVAAAYPSFSRLGINHRLRSGPVLLLLSLALGASFFIWASHVAKEPTPGLRADGEL